MMLPHAPTALDASPKYKYSQHGTSQCSLHFTVCFVIPRCRVGACYGRFSKLERPIERRHHQRFAKSSFVMVYNFKLDTLVNNPVSLDFDAHNPLTMEVAIDRVVSMAGLNGTAWVSFDQEFAQPVVVPPLSTANSGSFGNVLLTQGTIPSLDIIPIGVLDLISTDVYLRANTTNESLGVPIQIKGLKQNTVPTSWDLNTLGHLGADHRSSRCDKIFFWVG